MNKFLFITHLTPVHKRSSLRQSLIDCYFQALLGQTYPDWKGLILGEEERDEGRFRYVRLSDGTSEQKWREILDIFQRPDIKALLEGSDYIVKLDDDDIISPHVLADVSEKQFDCCYDSYHTFYDISSGQIGQQLRPWIASTCIHRKEHALASYKGEGCSGVGNLLYSDHSKSWHNYYKDKKVIVADKSSPVYLRVLSPTSVTAGAAGNAVHKAEDISFEKYYAYLRSFGRWGAAEISSFAPYYPILSKAWAEFSKFEQKAIPVPGPFSRFAGRIRTLWNRK
ncbi:MAG: hypothetical protein AB1458_16200 [Bacteroidota bacterium]